MTVTIIMLAMLMPPTISAITPIIRPSVVSESSAVFLACEWKRIGSHATYVSEEVPMRILIVEDDRDLAAALDDALRFEGYATRVAYNGLEAVRMLAEQSIDIVLLDRDLPIMSGDAVMETIASNDIPVSVLMLTAAAQVRDRINGLELGADDYLIKPFAYPELLARIRALQRRAGKGDFSGTEFSHNGIVLDTVRHTVTRDGKPVNLSPKEYGVLLEIMKADGSYVNAEELFDTVWAGASATDLTDAIKTTVYSLRRKLGEGNGITSTRGKGYRLS